jgi:hypothetical protein
MFRIFNLGPISQAGSRLGLALACKRGWPAKRITVGYPLAANMGYRVLPKRVHLHRGTRDGARALSLDWRADSLDPRVLPKGLAVLEPYEVEDFLCIFKSQLANVRKSRLPTWRTGLAH